MNGCMATDAPALLELHAWPGTAEAATAGFQEPLRSWIRQHLPHPTAIQRLAWPRTLAGENVLLGSPTGTGKTLAAFLPLLNRWLVSNSQISRGFLGLYLAPLKALGRDARKNLIRMQRSFSPSYPGPLWRLGLRTGDTSQRTRRQQVVDPPEVLFTTPESLALLLARTEAGDLFGNLQWVVVDEVHDLAGNKRGSDLAISLERVERLRRSTAPLQRIGLSATCTPIFDVARFLVGADRTCSVANVRDCSPFEIQIEPLPDDESLGFMRRLLDRVIREFPESGTTLIFTNTRNLAERVSWALRRRFPDKTDAIAIHHSALAPARRLQAERRLKNGELWVMVSSTSLELGIDIGSVDRVILIHPPGSAVRLLQRIGRSGHAPGLPRRGLVLTASAHELLEAAATAACCRQGQIERILPLKAPLDVLCQHLVGLAMQEAWCPVEALALVRRAYPFRNITDADFSACLDYLSGRRSTGEDWLPARLRWECDSFQIVNARTARLMKRNLGTIVTDEPRAIRLLLPVEAGSDGLPRTLSLGDLDPGWADNLKPGDRFMLESRCLQVKKREGTQLIVEEVLGRPEVPHWYAYGASLAVELAKRIYLYRSQANESLREGAKSWEHFLIQENALPTSAGTILAEYLQAQEQQSLVPTWSTLLIELVRQDAMQEYYLHTPLPKFANEMLGKLLAYRLARATSYASVVLSAEMGLVWMVEGTTPLAADFFRTALVEETFEADLADALREAPLFRERFGQVAQTGLMVLRQPMRGRPKVGGGAWAANRLFDSLQATDPDFVLLRQARRELLESAEAFALKEFLRETVRRDLVIRPLSEPSPFGQMLLNLPFSTTRIYADEMAEQGAKP